MGNPFGSAGDVKKPDGVTTSPADAHDLQTYVDASRQLSELNAPLLFQASSSNQRLFIAAFDGTGNDMSKDAKTGHMTNVALIATEISNAYPNRRDPVRVEYVEGPGTQNNFITRTFDGAKGFTYEARLERMYDRLIEQSKIWVTQNPNAEIRVIGIGFSRGAEQDAGFARLIHERGIQDPSSRHVYRDEQGQRHIEYTKPPLVPPGEIAQAVGLFDPVGTGNPRDHDRRLPPSVISGFQITAEDERRDQFKSTNIIDPGMSENNHFLNVTVGGAHSNLGGSYVLNGLAIRNHNLMADYLNSLSDIPLVQKQPVPLDPALNVVHRSSEHLYIYGTKDFERNDGRVRIEQVAPKHIGHNGVEINNKELHDEAMAQRFKERRVPIASEVTIPAKLSATEAKRDPTQSTHPDHPLYLQSQEAVRKLDNGMGRTSDANSDRMAASLTVLAKQEGLQRIDHVVLSRGTDAIKAGENVIIVQGKLNDPTHLRAHMKTQTAVEMPVSESFKQLHATTAQQKPELAQQQNLQTSRDAIIPQQAMQEPEVQRQAISR